MKTTFLLKYTLGVLLIYCQSLEIFAQDNYGAPYYSVIGKQNTFVGKDAGRDNTWSTNNNSFFGYKAGFSNFEGTGNTFLGSMAGFYNYRTHANTFVGFQAGYKNNSSYNTFVGYYAGRLTESGQNTFVGYRAGENTIDGSGNVILGFQAAKNRTSGSFNVIIGHQAGGYEGGGNTFVGTEAGFSNRGSLNCYFGESAGRNARGSNNAFFGSGAGYHNNANNNVFVGYYSGNANTEGNNNSFLGANTGYSNTTGSNNTFVGTNSGKANNEGKFNAFFGTDAGGENTTGEGNTFIGRRAGNFNNTGNENTFVGHFAGLESREVSNNTFVGSRAGIENFAGYNNTFLGAKAGEYNVNGLSNVYLGHQSGQNNTSGNQNSFVGKDAGIFNTSGSDNTFLGKGSGWRNTSGSYNLFLGKDAGNGNTTGSGNTLIGYLASQPTSLPNLTNATAIGFRASVSTSNALILGAINGVNGATANTKVGIRTTSPGYTLHVNASDAAKVGGGSWVVASDKRLKQDISEFADGLEMVQQIKPVWFRYNGKAGITTEKKYVGVIAQEIQEIAPYMVGEFVYEDTTGKQEKYLDYDASALTYMLVNAVKQQQEQIEILKQELTQIKQLLGKQLPAASSVAKLWQNEPNPYQQATLIRYFVPETAKSVQLKVFSITGQEVFSQEISQKGQGEVVLSNSRFSSGTYLYRLIVDGQTVDTKKMALTR